jgi:hypothetical protein
LEGFGSAVDIGFEIRFCDGGTGEGRREEEFCALRTAKLLAEGRFLGGQWEIRKLHY